MLFVLDRQERIINTLKNGGSSSSSVPYFDDILHENLKTGAETLQFTTIIHGNLSRDLIVGNYIAFKKDKYYKLFQIIDTEEYHDENMYMTVYCECAGLELLNSVIRGLRLPSATLKSYLQNILVDTGWNVGYIAAGAINSLDLNIDNVPVYTSLQENLPKYNVELEFRVEINNGRIAKKYIDTYTNRGKVTGKRFVYGRDIETIRRKTSGQSLYTALIGRGKNGINFRDITVEGIDKPAGQDFVADQEAFNRYNHNGFHIVGIYDYDTDSPEDLLRQTYKRLQEVKVPMVSYEIDVALLGELLSIDPDKISIGDTVGVVDNEFNPPIHLMARVADLYTSRTDKNQNKCVLSNFIEVSSNISDEIRDIASDLEGKLDDKLNSKFPIGGDDIQGGVIDGGHIGNDAISSDHISADSITAEKILAGEIKADHIATDTIKSKHISTDQIVSKHIAAEQIEAGHIKALQIDTGHIKSNSIETDHLKAGSIIGDKILGDTIEGKHIKGDTIEGGNIKGDTIEGKHIKADAIKAIHIEADSIGAEHIVTGTITAGSGIIAEGAIGSLEVSEVDAGKISSGTVDTSKVTVAGPNGNLKLTGNRIQVFEGLGNERKERVSLGDVNGDSTQYGLLVRGKDGQTVIFDETGITEAGITDGLITNEKISGETKIDGYKLNINSVVTEINKDGVETIKGTKIDVDGTNLSMKLSEVTTTQNEQGEKIEAHRTKIEANEKAIALKVEGQVYEKDMEGVNTKLTKNTSSIEALEESIKLKVEQSDIDSAIDSVEVIINKTVKLITTEYAINTSPTTPPTTGWTTTPPIWSNGKYIWSKTTTLYVDDTFNITDPICITGAKGQDGNSGKGVKSIVEKYCLHTSATSAPTSGWVDTPPTWENGKYMWTKSIITYTDSSITETSPICVTGSKGQNGSNGISISSVDVLYYKSTSSTELIGGTWQTTAPEWENGKYIWTKTKTTLSNSTVSETTAVCITGQKGASGIAAKSLSLSSTTYAVAFDVNNLPKDSSDIILTVFQQNDSTSIIWETTPTIPLDDGPTANTKKFAPTRLQNIPQVQIKVKAGDLIDTITIVKVKDGDKGNPGSDGNGISSITNYYLASTANSGVTTSTSGWTTAIQTIDSSNKYLWNYEKITYTNNSTTSTTPVIIGTYGDKGQPGSAGSDGKGISKITEYYLVSPNNSGITTSTAGWSTAIPTMTASNKYLWNYEVTDYTDKTSSSTLPKIIGAYGDKGQAGEAGIDAYTIVLTNESHTFAGTTSAAIAGNTSCSVIAYKGSTRVAATIGAITGHPTGMTTSVASNGTTGASFTINVTTSMITKNGELTIPITVDGKAFTKKFTFSLALTGNTGGIGQGVDSITTQYYLSTSKTTQTGGSWVDLPPTWVEGKYMWTRSKIVYKNPSSTAYTTPMCDSSWEVAKKVDEKVTNIDKKIASIDIKLDGITSKVEHTEGKIRINGGKMLYTDPTFTQGLNGIKVYNNNSSTANVVLVTRITKISDCPTTSTHCVEIKTTGPGSTPGLGGFSWQTQTRANAIFTTKILAKIPTGYNLVFATNAAGTDSNSKWLTDNKGTGKWEEYICEIKCGNDGTFSNTNFFNLTGTAPVTWYLGSATVYDCTDATDVDLRIQSAEQQLTPTSIINKVNESLGKDGTINSVSTILDKTGFTVKNGAIKIQNKAGQIVMTGDTDGNLWVQNKFTVGGNTNGNIVVKDASNLNVATIDKTGIKVAEGKFEVTNEFKNGGHGGQIDTTSLSGASINFSSHLVNQGSEPNSVSISSVRGQTLEFNSPHSYFHGQVIADKIISSSPQNASIEVSSSTGKDTEIVLDRGSNANWRFLNTGGILKMQNDFNVGKGDYYDVMNLYFGTGDVSIRGGLEFKGAMSHGSEYEDGKGYYNFTKGCLITTNIKNTTNTMTELYITGNSYGVAYPIDIKVNCYTYNGDIISRSSLSNGYATPVNMFYDSNGYLCFWLKQAEDWNTFRFKLCTSTGTSSPSYTVIDSEKPTNITKDGTAINQTSYTTKNSWTIVERGADGTNGSFIRFSDGTQICWKTSQYPVEISVPTGGMYESKGTVLFGSWERQFIKAPYVFVMPNGSFAHFVGNAFSITASSAGGSWVYKPTATGATTVHHVVFGIGRWK